MSVCRHELVNNLGRRGDVRVARALLRLGGVASEPLLDTLHELLQEHGVGQVTGPLLVS
jgi:hypothetical protein